MFERNLYQSLGLGTVFDKVMHSERLSFDDGLRLFTCPDVTAVGALAFHVRTKMHADKTFYVVNRQINYTNICVNGCTFCAFHRDKASENGAFSLSKEDILQRIKKACSSDLKLDELHIVGGCHPNLRLSWFEDLFRSIKQYAPDLPIKAFTPVEIAHFAKMEGCSTQTVLERLKNCGLVMLPGGGAEIFDEKLRAQLCPAKANAQTWLKIAGEAHALGLKTNCTMLFGHVENLAHRVDHLLRLRDQQDKSHGFTCFIPLPYLQKNNKLQLPKERLGNVNGLDHLRTIAVARLLLDNIPHIKAYWIMLGVKMAQTALWYGADDLDGTIVEEHIGHMAGARSAQELTLQQLESMIKNAGFTPIRRNATFQELVQSQTAAHSATHSPFQENQSVTNLAKSVLNGNRLDFKDAKILYTQANLETLAFLAHTIRKQKHPEPIVTYVGDRNINYSNICVCGCRFCAFFRPPNDPEGYVLDRDTLSSKIEETLRLGGTQILLQGGHNPDLPFSWYEDLLNWMHTSWPTLHIHAFSPPEIFYWSKLYGLSIKEILTRLQAAGLTSIPGGGAEILQNEVRARVSPNKCTADEWLDVMRQAHNLGMRTTATMMFGHEETYVDRLEHLFRVRQLQDETNGFTAFIPWTFQPNHTRIHCQPLPAPEYLRLLAIARLVLDNVDNIQASWVTMGPEIAQIALFYGANDFGSLMIEENVVAAAGVSFSMSRKDIHDVILACGYTPMQRTMDYHLLDPQFEQPLA